MTRRTRADWIEAGFDVLSEAGDAGLTVDEICARLDRSKGSFYHHFGGRPGYVEALLEAWERRATDRIIASGRSEEPVRSRLRSLNQHASELRNATLERAIRAWAAREPLAKSVQDRVDRKRLEFLEEICSERMGSGDGAKRLARVFQLLFVGAQHLDPPLEGPELYGTFRFLEPLFEGRSAT